MFVTIEVDNWAYGAAIIDTIFVLRDYEVSLKEAKEGLEAVMDGKTISFNLKIKKIDEATTVLARLEKCGFAAHLL